MSSVEDLIGTSCKMSFWVTKIAVLELDLCKVSECT